MARVLYSFLNKIAINDAWWKKDKLSAIKTKLPVNSSVLTFCELNVSLVTVLLNNLLCARHFTYVISVMLPVSYWGGCDPHFADEEIETQGWLVQSHRAGKWWSQYSNPGLYGLRAHALSTVLPLPLRLGKRSFKSVKDSKCLIWPPFPFFPFLLKIFIWRKVIG